MSHRIQRAVWIGLLMLAGVGAGACLSPLGTACGNGWCPDGYLCTPVSHVCIKSTCGDAIVEAGEECDDGNLDDEDSCLSICKRNRCGDGKVDSLTEACDDGNINNDDGCSNDCTIGLSAYVKASNTDVEDYFGSSIALSADGSTLAVAAIGEDSVATGIDGNQIDNSAELAGAVYIFTRHGVTWQQQAYIKSPYTGIADSFGFSVALSADGSFLAVGAIWEGSAARGNNGNQTNNSVGNSGAVHVFTRSGITWHQQAYFKASITYAGDGFGWSVALSADGSTLAVGTVGDSGAVYVFTRSGTSWRQQAYVKASNTDSGDGFGASVALSADGSTLAVGAPWEDSAATGVDGDQANDSARYSGAVYVFTRSGTTWRQQAYVKASNTDADDRFGISVALSADGSTLAVGALWEASAAIDIGGDQADNSCAYAGAVYVFTRSNATWSQQAYVKASNTRVWSLFGVSVALSADGSTLAVGALWEASAATGIGGDQINDFAEHSGAAYVFTRSGASWSQQAYVKASNTGIGDNFGTGVALSANGSILAVGAPREGSAATGIGGDQGDDSAAGAGAVYVYLPPAQQDQQSLSAIAALSELNAPASAASVPAVDSPSRSSRRSRRRSGPDVLMSLLKATWTPSESVRTNDKTVLDHAEHADACAEAINFDLAWALTGRPSCARGNDG